MQKGLKWLSVVTAVWMFFVLLGGALVTKTESGRGCGDDWPLCNGKFVPAYTVESILEYSHRVVSGVAGLLIVSLFALVWWKWRQRKDMLLYVGGALFFTVLQAFLGAMAVWREQSSAVMALHFGFSLIAFACTLLLAIAASRVHLPWHKSGWGEKQILDGPRVDGKFRMLAWGAFLYTYVVVYVGAYVRHTESWAGCQGWPLCNGQVVPSLSGETGIAFFHRVAALLLVLLILRLAYKASVDYPHIRVVSVSGRLAFLLVGLQVASGAFVAYSLSSADMLLWSGLLHTVIVACLFGVLCYISILVWQLRESKMEEEHDDAPQFEGVYRTSPKRKRARPN